MPFPNPQTQFPPGQSGNPLGRPKKGIITDEAILFLEEEHPRRPGKTRKRVLAEQWVKRAAKQQPALDSLLVRVEGKVPDPVETSNELAEAIEAAEKRAIERKNERETS